MSSFETLLPPPIRSRYENNDSSISKNKLPFYKKLHIGHANCFITGIILIILTIISIQITPLVNDANELVHDGSNTLKDMNVIIPDVTSTLNDMNTIIPNVKKTVHDMNIIIPQVKNTLDDMTIIMPEIKDILRMVKSLCQFENFTNHYGFLCN